MENQLWRVAVNVRRLDRSKNMMKRGYYQIVKEPASNLRREFDCFIKNHIDLKNVTSIITENNYYMVGSYVMIDPSGRYYNNLNHTYTYSDPILKVGVKKALSQITYDEEKYFKRKTSL